MESEIRGRLLSLLIGIGLVIGGSVAGFLVGYGMGVLIEGDDASNVHGGFMLVMLLSLGGGIVGFVVGFFYADKVATKRRIRRESDAPN